MFGVVITVISISIVALLVFMAPAMASFGRQVMETAGVHTGISADGKPIMKAGGVTIDWTAITAVSGSAVTLADGSIVAIGDKYIERGEILAKITASGKYRPSRTGSADGSQTLLRGSCYLCARAVILSEMGSDHAPVLEGGLVYLSMLQIGTGTQQVEASLLTAFPELRLIRETP